MDYYDGIASGYDELYGKEQLDKLAFIRAHLVSKGLRIESSWSLLDVGCGTGISTAFFDCEKRVGVDPSEELLEIARKKYPDIHFIEGSAEDLEGKKQYDLVISLTAIQNFHDLEKGLDRVLAHGKRYILSIVKQSPRIDEVRKKLSGFEEIEAEKDIIFIKF